MIDISVLPFGMTDVSCGKQIKVILSLAHGGKQRQYDIITKTILMIVSIQNIG